MEDSLIQRIKAICEYYRLSVNALAKKIMMAQTTLNNYIIGRRKPSFELISMILESFPEISSEWLLRGEGEMLRKDDVKKEHCTMCAAKDKQIFLLEKLIKKYEDEDKANSNGKYTKVG